jgi:hypothetical protein
VRENPSSFEAVERGPANLFGLRGTTGAQNISFRRGQELQGVTLRAEYFFPQGFAHLWKYRAFFT